ncbi:MAG: thioredoxin family protein [Ignavibacteria bacterium]|jgi:hypothetical protein
MARQFFLDQRPHNGMSYSEFINESIQNVKQIDIDSLDEKEKDQIETKKLNHHRSKRIDKTYRVNSDLEKMILGIEKPQIWMVLTEDWCGDSAQNLPHIAKLAELNSQINLRILERDKNLDIMACYLTDGKSRSIPKLVAFDEEGNELFHWGSRPAKLQKLVDKWKAEGLQKSEWLKKLHLEYGRNRGKFFEEEFQEVLSKYLLEKDIEQERVLC